MSNAQIASMTKRSRETLSGRLKAFDEDLVRDTNITRQRRRRIIDLLVIVCLGLIPWIVFLGLTLPHRYVANHWEVAWVGYDVALLCALAATAWAAWRRRQIVILALLVTGTVLIVDAWFDILTDSTTRDLIISLVARPSVSALSRAHLHNCLSPHPSYHSHGALARRRKQRSTPSTGAALRHRPDRIGRRQVRAEALGPFRGGVERARTGSEPRRPSRLDRGGTPVGVEAFFEGELLDLHRCAPHAVRLRVTHQPGYRRADNRGRG